jgi:thymidylate synthase, flavin-dependent
MDNPLLEVTQSNWWEQSFPVLDHGYLRYVEHWGSDERIVESARMSTGKGHKGWGTPETPGDEKLLAYLYEHRHHSPFEMAGLTLEVQAPIFVFREWHRHRTQSYNEMSSRYVPLPDVNYVPTVERLQMRSATNKQAQGVVGAPELSSMSAESFRQDLLRNYRQAQELYEQALAAGIAKELARVHLPVGRYSRMRASANLRNWLAFLTLRMDPAAQWEIREYACQLGSFIERLYPRTWKLFVNGLHE